jgi:hypothetical protein
MKLGLVCSDLRYHKIILPFKIQALLEQSVFLQESKIADNQISNVGFIDESIYPVDSASILFGCIIQLCLKILA